MFERDDSLEEIPRGGLLVCRYFQICPLAMWRRDVVGRLRGDPLRVLEREDERGRDKFDSKAIREVGRYSYRPWKGETRDGGVDVMFLEAL